MDLSPSVVPICSAYPVVTDVIKVLNSQFQSMGQVASWVLQHIDQYHGRSWAVHAMSMLSSTPGARSSNSDPSILRAKRHERDITLSTQTQATYLIMPSWTQINVLQCRVKSQDLVFIIDCQVTRSRGGARSAQPQPCMWEMTLQSIGRKRTTSPLACQQIENITDLVIERIIRPGTPHAFDSRPCIVLVGKRTTH